MDGLIKEYIIKVVDERGDNETIATTANQATTQPTSPTTAPKKSQPSAPAQTAKSPVGTWQAVNMAAQIALPALNAVTNGMASQAWSHVSRIAQFTQAVATGSTGGVVGAVVSAAAWAVGQTVSTITQERQRNLQMAQSIDATNRLRASVGLSTLEYANKGLLKKVTITGDR